MYKQKIRYQLVYPYDGKKIYESSSLTKAAQKCYNELKQSVHYNVANKFTILDIDNFKKYDFALKKKNTQFGGDDNQAQQEPLQIQQNIQNINDDGIKEAENIVNRNNEDIKNNEEIKNNEDIKNNEISNKLSILDIKLEKIISMMEQQEINKQNRENELLKKKLQMQKCKDNDDCSIM
jgi:hypothetical protein